MIVYGTHDCPHCDKAKAMLDAAKVRFTFVNLYEDTMGAWIMALGRVTSIPYVVCNGTIIGGAAELADFLARGANSK